ncbi:MAG: hypothetical protein LBH25_07135 [Fibromonadaceae bacterium]|jgi:uncharacterized protein (TIGR02145 family)|nr:hypothetical protein [Fibromonadaceae bacterium]
MVKKLFPFAVVLYFLLGCSNDGSGGGNNYSTIMHGGEAYETVVIGSQRWFKRNLNYNVAGSKCYGEDEDNYDYYESGYFCETYGRLYDWATAMALPPSCNSSTCASRVQTKHQGICPPGWHIPSNEDWDRLLRYVDGSSGTSSPYSSCIAGYYLKANGMDFYGFSALLGGEIWYDKDWYDENNSVFRSGGAGEFGHWWSSGEYDSEAAYKPYISNYGHYGCPNNDFVVNNTYMKETHISIRCVED